MFSERNYNKRFKLYNAGFYAVPTIILANILVFILQQVTLTRTALGYPFSSVTFSFALIPYKVIYNFEIWRLFTYMFLHGGFWHILLNMWGVYLFGTMLERRMGSFKFLVLYLVSGVFGGIFWMLFNLSGFSICIGASGAVFGIIVGAALLFPDVQIMLLFPPIPLKLRTFAIIYALIETFSAVSGVDGQVAHLAHIGGLIAGYILIRFMYPRDVYDIFKFIKIFSNKKTGVNFSKKASEKWTMNFNSAPKIDDILDKISRSGINSLTQEEVDILKKARENMRSGR